MKSSSSSIRLTRAAVAVIAVLLIVLALFLPVLLSRLTAGGYRNGLHSTPLFLTASYLCIGCALWILYRLNLLLMNIGSQAVFTEANIRLLHEIGSGCFAVCLIGGIAQFYYLPWLFVFLAAGFMTLILHVIRNVFEQARRIKEENDYTV